jgi:hypothetical protein
MISKFGQGGKKYMLTFSVMGEPALKLHADMLHGAAVQTIVISPLLRRKF